MERKKKSYTLGTVKLVTLYTIATLRGRSCSKQCKNRCYKTGTGGGGKQPVNTLEFGREPVATSLEARGLAHERDVQVGRLGRLGLPRPRGVWLGVVCK